jgi:hypothetical protein
MDEQERNMIAITARMDGARAVAARIGKGVKLSEMELIALANFARLGLLFVFSQLDGDAGDDAHARAQQHCEELRDTFESKPGQRDGLNHLTQCCTAMLGGERLGKYVVIPQDSGSS